MLVDLARNDLSRNCHDVQVEFYKEAQYYRNFESLVRTSREWDNPPCRIELLIVDKKNAFAVKRAENLGIRCV